MTYIVVLRKSHRVRSVSFISQSHENLILCDLIWQITCNYNSCDGGHCDGQVTARSLQWRHNDHYCVSNHQPRGCLLNRLFRRRSKKTSKLRVTGLCVGNSPGTGEFPAQMASNAENVSILWRHHVAMLGLAGDNPWIFLDRWSFKGLKFIWVLWNLLEIENELWVSHHENQIEFRFWIEFLIGRFILDITFSFNWNLCSEYREPIT